MAGARPFASREDLHEAAERAWWALGREDWMEAFAAHPRIGARTEASGWSAQEQAAAQAAADATRAELAAVNAAYEARFGYTFIVCATGRSGDAILADAKRRLHNDPGTELRTAAAEQAAITRLRLDKLLATP
jgi:OHCU decarboxylase